MSSARSKASPAEVGRCEQTVQAMISARARFPPKHAPRRRIGWRASGQCAARVGGQAVRRVGQCRWSEDAAASRGTACRIASTAVGGRDDRSRA
eukprot:CAMPEP_0179842994 /NCGR_PEP_ID=MMETSP0982-20121206/3443_1 /TAXON_ID=483367 /ORGANISM="non described non described, Strain CCMP 2436" /LENGTH=93 /DNA_ID=CAMNT_0021727343 /DNA_START=653 /DNA_END=931 /DNA_ORIENTATION=-